MRRVGMSMGRLLGLGVLLVACDKTPQECQQLDRILKANGTDLKDSQSAEYKADPRKAAKLARAYASAVEAEIGQLGSLELTNTRLARYSEDLRATLKEATDAAKRLALAYDALVKPNDASCAAEDAWNASKAPITKLCKATEPTCAQIDTLPEPGAGDRSLADELLSHATKLEGIQIDDPELAKAVNRRVSLARDYAAALRATSIQAGKVDTASGAYFQAITRGRPALRDIDRECKR